MFDKRVIRGCTYAVRKPPPPQQQPSPPPPRSTPTRYRKPPVARATPPPPMEDNDDDVWEVIPGAPLVPTPLPRPPTPPYIPPPYGIDKSIQVDADEIFDFEVDVLPFLEVLVGHALAQSVAEIEEEDEMNLLKHKREEFGQLRTAEISETQRFEYTKTRLIKERQRREDQALEHQAREEAKKEDFLAYETARSTSKAAQHVAENHLHSECVYTDPVRDTVELGFMPWLFQHTNKRIERARVARMLVDNLLQGTLEKSAEKHRKWKLEEAERWRRLEEERQMLENQGRMTHEDELTESWRPLWLADLAARSEEEEEEGENEGEGEGEEGGDMEAVDD
eukprot:gnl/Trimastix_PCT/2268.p2 GENE.gnl/Trimastix_PCT/2268~~gnl/Trimastix_PCT/2268.p2  ORF type:complete len:367 (+),score=95.04 gnl/Trimastix_PCT/2268:93-1103(+)